MCPLIKCIQPACNGNSCPKDRKCINICPGQCVNTCEVKRGNCFQFGDYISWFITLMGVLTYCTLLFGSKLSIVKRV